MPMTPSLNLSFYCGESYSTTDTKATSSSTALNLAWPSFHPGFVSYTTCHIPCSATLLSLGMRRKVQALEDFPLPTHSATQPATA